ncbi:glycosyltransferase [Brachybacterium paraconglomeratum]|uniref:glycosyltransferase n=1 Tax=Brachybacterium paraconglomeratum TaxID=173362 RepID=UPI0037CA835E
MSVRLSVVIPVYNAADKLSDCIDSLRRLEAKVDPLEVIFVDDCSTDASLEILREKTSSHPSWRVISLEANTGSPSTPRNVGAREAVGEYLVFLDADDALFPDGVNDALLKSEQGDYDLVRAPMLVVENSREYVHNRVPGFDRLSSNSERIAAIFRHQSTTPTMVIRTASLRASGVTWQSDLRMGEDTVFLAELCAATSSIGYSESIIYKYDRRTSDVASSTQTYGERELSNHLRVWSATEAILEAVGVDYFAVRGQIALQAMAQSFIRSYTGDLTRSTFSALTDYLRARQEAISTFKYSPRIRGVVDSAIRGSIDNFLEEIKPRMVIAGYDLKFITPIISALEDLYSIRVDEWIGHDRHDLEQSQEMLEWADLIWCEWLLGNAVWYSRNKRRDQTLIIRMHRFEAYREFGHKIDKSRVDAYITVSLFTLEDFVRSFDLDRSRCRVIPNYIDSQGYRQGSDPERVYKLALVGAVPKRKGLHRAVHVLSRLREVDSRYELTLFGQNYSEMPWLSRIDEEREYFEEVSHQIKALGLSNHVRHAGWVDTKAALADHGVVLSTSDAESFHVAPFESLAAGNAAVVLKWDGAQYVYPAECIADSEQQMFEHILSLRDLTVFEERSARCQAFVREAYSPKRFIRLVAQLVKDIR